MNEHAITPPWQEPFVDQVDRELRDLQLQDARLAEQLDGIGERRAVLRPQINDLEATIRTLSALADQSGGTE